MVWILQLHAAAFPSPRPVGARNSLSGTREVHSLTLQPMDLLARPLSLKRRSRRALVRAGRLRPFYKPSSRSRSTASRMRPYSGRSGWRSRRPTVPGSRPAMRAVSAAERPRERRQAAKRVPRAGEASGTDSEPRKA